MSAAAGPTPRTAAMTLVDAVRAELTKIVTLPATWLTISSTTVLGSVLSLFFASQAGEGAGAMGSLDIAMAALPYSQAGLLVLGVIIACSEHVGGQIRTTLVAMPHRVAQRLAAFTALVLVAFPAALLVIASGVLTTAVVLGRHRDFSSLGSLLATVLSAAVYLVLMVVLSAAVGSLARRALPAAGALVLYLVVVSPLMLGQPFAFALPDIAGYTLWFSDPPVGAPSAPVAWLTVLTWTLAALVPSILVFRARDV